MNKKLFKIAIFLAVAVIVVVAAVQIVKKKKKALSQLPTPKIVPLPVEVAKVKTGKLFVTEHYLGKVEPLISAKISSKVSGYLIAVNKYEGDPVKKGEVLARIDDKPIRERIASLKAQIEAAKTAFLTKKHIFERDRILYKNKAISKEAFEISETNFKEAKARLETLKSELASAENDLLYTVIKAPFDGVVTARFKDPGDLVVPGAPILEVEKPSAGYRILVGVPQAKAAVFKPGAPAVLTEGSKKLNARIFRVFPAVGAGELATVEIRLTERPFNLPSGSKIGVDLVASEVKGAIVPLRALLENVNATYVFVTEPAGNGTARIKPVKVHVLGRSGDKVAVSGPVRGGDLVVVAEESTLLKLYRGEVVHYELSKR